MDPLPGGPDWMPINPKAGSLFHADSQTSPARWRERYLESGLQGIERDLPRGAPPVKVDVAKLVA